MAARSASGLVGRIRGILTHPGLAAREAAQDAWAELRSLLDEVLGSLPAKYRAVVLLCDLEGKTRKEAAAQLGVPQGTVAGRLARARALLARRLAGRGVALPAGGLAAL